MVDNNTEDDCKHQWRILSGEVKLKCNMSSTYQCSKVKKDGVQCKFCSIYLCINHQPNLQTEQKIEDWFQKQGQKKISVTQLISIIEKNFKQQGQQFSKSSKYNGDWMYPGDNGDYHVHFNNAYFGFKSTLWGNEYVFFKKIGSQYKSIRDNKQQYIEEKKDLKGQQKMSTSKGIFLQFIRQLMEIIKKIYQ